MVFVIVAAALACKEGEQSVRVCLSVLLEDSPS